MLVSNLSSVERAVEVEWTGLPADAPLQLVRTALGPGTAVLEEAPLGTGTPRAGRLVVTTSIAPLSTWLLVARP